MTKRGSTEDRRDAALKDLQKAVTAMLAEGFTEVELRDALERRLREEAERRVRSEVERLRKAGFTLEAEINGRPLWTHGKFEGHHYWHDEALAMLAQESA